MPIVVRHESRDRFRIGVRGHALLADQPDTGDAGPTPVELFVASIAACAAFYARRFLARHGLADADLRVEATHVMSEGLPARVARIELRVHIPVPLDDAVRDGALRAIESCTVANSVRVAPLVRTEIVRNEIPWRAPDASPALVP